MDTQAADEILKQAHDTLQQARADESSSREEAGRTNEVRATAKQLLDTAATDFPESPALCAAIRATVYAIQRIEGSRREYENTVTETQAADAKVTLNQAQEVESLSREEAIRLSQAAATALSIEKEAKDLLKTATKGYQESLAIVLVLRTHCDLTATS